MKINVIKIVLGAVIFLFSLALAYFSASYLDQSQVSSGLLGFGYAHSSTYWVVLAAFAGGYVLVGILISFVIPLSLGFLFSADILLLNILFEQYGKIGEVYKVLLVAFILFILYIFAWLKLGDEPPASYPTTSPAQVPPVFPHSDTRNY